MNTVYLVSEVRSPLVDFGLAEIRKALNAAGLEAVGPWPELRDDPAPRPMIVVRADNSSDEVDAFIAGADGQAGPTYPDESFTVTGAGGRVVIEAAHPRGLMYGCLEVADLIRAERWADPQLVDRYLGISRHHGAGGRNAPAGHRCPPGLGIQTVVRFKYS